MLHRGNGVAAEPVLVSDRLPPDADIVVIGAGVAGICTALFLARRGRDVVVLDRAGPWSEASGANASALGPQDKLLDVLDLGRSSVDLWEKLETEMGLDVGFVKSGGLRVATSEAAAQHMRIDAEEQMRRGLELEWLDGNELRDRAPWLGPKVRAATFCVDDCYVNAFAAGGALVAGVVKAGARIIGHAEVRGARDDRGVYSLDTTKGVIRAQTLVIAAGPWSAAIARMLGIELPLYVDVNMLTVLEPAPIFMHTSLLHAEAVLSLKQYANGTVLVGGGWQGRGRFAQMEKYTDNLHLRQNYKVAVEVAPILGRLRVMRTWAGYEAVAPDALPILGRLPGVMNAYIATGARGGFSLGPAQGLAIAEMIANGGVTSIPIGRFDPARLLGGGGT